MSRLDKVVAKMRSSPQNVTYAELHQACVHFFGEPRQRGTSHAVFRTPWKGDPRVNIQQGKAGKAKVYQVRQVVRAIDRMEDGS